MSTSFGSRRLVVGAHYGLRDWLAQRITSLLMALFTIVLLLRAQISKGVATGAILVSLLFPPWFFPGAGVVVLAIALRALKLGLGQRLLRTYLLAGQSVLRGLLIRLALGLALGKFGCE